MRQLLISDTPNTAFVYLFANHSFRQKHRCCYLRDKWPLGQLGPHFSWILQCFFFSVPELKRGGLLRQPSRPICHQYSSTTLCRNCVKLSLYKPPKNNLSTEHRHIFATNCCNAWRSLLTLLTDVKTYLTWWDSLVFGPQRFAITTIIKGRCIRV